MILPGTKIEDVKTIEIVTSLMFSTRLVEHWYMVIRLKDEQKPYGVAVFKSGVCERVATFATVGEACVYARSMQEMAQVLE